MGSAQKGKTALIWGASGVTGWSFVNEILNDYPEKGVWTKVHAMTNRPLKPEDSIWPSDSRLNIVSGVDLLKGSQEELETELRSKVQGVEEVTHVYYLAYKASKDIQQELADAVAMFKRSTTAIDHLSPNLEFVVLQTGAKMYGCHLVERPSPEVMPLPLKESLPRLQSPAEHPLFYHPQIDWIEEYSKGKSWNWIDTRPDIIIGFVPNQNFYSLGTSVGIFLALFRAIEGEGATCTYPGSQKAWVAKSVESSSDMIARQTLHLSLSPKTERGGGYNVGDARTPSSWSVKWPVMCAYFGLKGAPPPTDSEPTEVRTYIKKNFEVWEGLEKKHGLKTGIADSPRNFQGFEYFLLSMFDFDRQYDMEKMYGTGFTEERTAKDTWGAVFDRMRAAKIIP